MKQGWEMRQLGEVCEVIAGQSPASKFYNSEGIGLPFYQGKKQFTDKYIGDPNTWTSRITKEAFEGDILMSVRAPVGPVNFSKQHICIGRGLASIRASKSIDKEFLFNFLLKHENEIDGNVGAVFNSINKAQIGSIPIPVPPLPEQERIVAILDICFEAIDKAKANVERNTQNAKDLFQSQLNQILAQKGDGWVENKLDELTTKIGSGATPRGGKTSYKESGVPLIRSLNVYDDGFRKRNLVFIDDEQASKLDNVEVKMGDVLLNITGASVARCCVVPKEYLPARVNQHVSIIRVKPEIMTSKYLHYSLISDDNKDLLLGIGEQGATRQAITKEQIKGFAVSYPADIFNQKTMVAQLDDLNEQTQSLESKYRQEFDSLDELKKSILHKAFNGELTETEEKAA